MEINIVEEDPPKPANADTKALLDAIDQVRKLGDQKWRSIAVFSASKGAAFSRAASLRKRPEAADMNIRGVNAGEGSKLFVQLKAAVGDPDEARQRRRGAAADAAD